MDHSKSRNIIEIDSDDDFVDTRGRRNTSTASTEKQLKSRRFRSLSTVPTEKLLEREESKPRELNCLRSSADSSMETTLANSETSSTSVPRRSPRGLSPNLSVLEKSSLYFGPGRTDPRMKAIAARTKNSLESCDAELKEKATQEESKEGKWQKFFDVFSSVENEEELLDNWEESSFVLDFDQTVIDPRLLQDTDSSEEEMEIVDPQNEFEKSSKEANGKELASFITGHSNKLKSKLSTPFQSEPGDSKCLVHISGSMSSDLCQGQFSNYKNTLTVKVFGLDLSFSREYLDTLRAMTGFDMRHSAYKIHIEVAKNGVSSTVQILNDSKELKNTKKLNDISLVNESVSSELNLSLRSKRLLRMLTPRKPKVEVTAVKKEIKTEGFGNPNDSTLPNSVALNRSKIIERAFSMLTPRKPKVEVKTVKKEIKTAGSGNPNDSTLPNSAALNRSRRIERAFSMLTPRKPTVEVKTESSDPNITFNPETTNNLSLCRRKFDIKSEPTSLSNKNPIESEHRSYACSKSPDFLPPLRIPPNVERCKSNLGLPRTVISPLKRNHNHSLNVTHEGSPSKRIRFHDESVLSSTRIDDYDWKQAEPNDRPSNYSSRLQPVNHHRSIYRGHMQPSHEYPVDPESTLTNSVDCIGSCCQPPPQQYDVSNYSRNQHHHNLYQHQQLLLQQTSRQHKHLLQQQLFQQHQQLPQLPQLPPYRDPAQIPHNDLPQCAGTCCGLQAPSRSILVPTTAFNHNTYQALPPTIVHQNTRHAPALATRHHKTREVLAHCQDAKPEKENISEPRYLVPKKGSALVSGIQIPIVTDLLKGLNSSKRKLKINVEYDVKLAEDDENSF